MTGRLSTCARCGGTIELRPVTGWWHVTTPARPHNGEPDDGAVSAPGADDNGGAVMTRPTAMECRLVGAGDGSVLVYARCCRTVLCAHATTLNAALGFWEEHLRQEHPDARCSLCGRIPADGEAHRQVYGGGPDGDDVEEVCVGPDRHQLAYEPVTVPDPWLDPDAAARNDPPPF